MELLTIAEIARALGLPDSTVRYYRDRFQTHLPCVGSGRSRRYFPEAVDILRDIMIAVKNGATLQEVRESLPSTKSEIAATTEATISAKAVPQAKTEEAKKSKKPDHSAKSRSTQKSGSAVRSRAGTATSSESAVQTAVQPVSNEIMSVSDENLTASDLQACRTIIESEFRGLHEEISTMREMISNLVQLQSESQVGERDKQLVEALKGLQSMKSVPKKRWFGLRS